MGAFSKFFGMKRQKQLYWATFHRSTAYLFLMHLQNMLHRKRNVLLCLAPIEKLFAHFWEKNLSTFFRRNSISYLQSLWINYWVTFFTICTLPSFATLFQLPRHLLLKIDIIYLLHEWVSQCHFWILKLKTAEYSSVDHHISDTKWPGSDNKDCKTSNLGAVVSQTFLFQHNCCLWCRMSSVDLEGITRWRLSTRWAEMC